MRATIAVLVLSAIALAGCTPIGMEPPTPPTASPSASPSPSVSPSPGAAPVLTLTMTGPPEVPPGDPDGTGTAVITLDVANSQVCVDFTVQGIDAATSAHLHDGVAGTAGPIVVDLPFPATGTVTGCVQTEPALVQTMIDDPARFYVNVHNLTYPKGAVRAQLATGAAAATVALPVAAGNALHCKLPRLV